LLKLIVKTTEIYQLLFSSFAGAGSWQLAMIQPYLFFVDVQLLLHITSLGFKKFMRLRATALAE
jgi:hypothetical protein